ncbi:hypothetical protein [Sorangium sp. So ce131]|uniref:hypothetical protein n=1 Tax=Sorangium sp. So ce131 TaxID=3133282 RepID=UPI003F5ECD59
MGLLLALGALSTFGAAGLSGCYYGDSCSDERVCLSPPKSLCDGHPATAPALDICGVFVSEQGDDNHPGTKDAPVKTLQHAIGLAAYGRDNGEVPTRRVYACGGTFKETVTLPSGVDVWGGRLCDGRDLSYEGLYDGPNQWTTIAPPVGIPLRVISESEEQEEEETATSTIFGVRVVAADASAEDHGRKGGLAVCGVATKGGAGGGSGGAGGCGGRGGRGGENGHPSVGIVALHAKLTVRDTVIETFDAGPGGDGGPPEQGGKPGRGAPGGAIGDGTWSCQGASGGYGGEGGFETLRFAE